MFVINPVDANPVGAGTYAVLRSGENATAVFAMASVHTYDRECHDTNETTVEGSVTFTEVGNVVRGTFDLTFADHEHVTGRFAAPHCTVTESDAGTCG